MSRAPSLQTQTKSSTKLCVDSSYSATPPVKTHTAPSIVSEVVVVLTPPVMSTSSVPTKALCNDSDDDDDEQYFRRMKRKLDPPLSTKNTKNDSSDVRLSPIGLTPPTVLQDPAIKGGQPVGGKPGGSTGDVSSMPLSSSSSFSSSSKASINRGKGCLLHKPAYLT